MRYIQLKIIGSALLTSRQIPNFPLSTANKGVLRAFIIRFIIWFRYLRYFNNLIIINGFCFGCVYCLTVRFARTKDGINKQIKSSDRVNFLIRAAERFPLRLITLLFVVCKLMFSRITVLLNLRRRWRFVVHSLIKRFVFKMILIDCVLLIKRFTTQFHCKRGSKLKEPI